MRGKSSHRVHGSISIAHSRVMTGLHIVGCAAFEGERSSLRGGAITMGVGGDMSRADSSRTGLRPEHSEGARGAAEQALEQALEKALKLRGSIAGFAPGPEGKN